MNTHVVDNITSSGSDETTDLVEAITALLIAAGHPQPDAWLLGLDPVALTTKDQNLQRFLINRQWRFLISNSMRGQDTTDVRYCLIDDGTVVDWFRVFKQGVLPCIMKHNLPLMTK